MSSSSPETETRASLVTPKSVVSVSIATYKESHQTSYLVSIRNSEGEAITPYKTPTLEHAIYEGHMWADFFGVELTPYRDENGEIVDIDHRSFTYMNRAQLIDQGCDPERVDKVLASRNRMGF